jgi:hypothetical protein
MEDRRHRHRRDTRHPAGNDLLVGHLPHLLGDVRRRKVGGAGWAQDLAGGHPVRMERRIGALTSVLTMAAISGLLVYFLSASRVGAFAYQPVMELGNWLAAQEAHPLLMGSVTGALGERWAALWPASPRIWPPGWRDF